MGNYSQINKREYLTDLEGNTLSVEFPPKRIWQYPDESDKKQRQKKHSQRPIFIIGFDTEFQSPEAISREQVAKGEGIYKVLSYQYHCKIINPLGEEGIEEQEWEGLCIPEINSDGSEKRLRLTEFLLLAIGAGFRENKKLVIPDEVYLVGHFTKADLPAFSDFGEIARNELDNIRRTFVDLKGSVKCEFHTGNENEPVSEIDVHLRDTILLAPTMAKSLADLGEIVGYQKLKLAEDFQEEKHLKSNMEKYRNENWETFHEYAIRDCIVCTKYFERVLNRCFEITGKYRAPFTLSSVGTELVWKDWEQNGDDPLELLGKEELDSEKYLKKTGRKMRGKIVQSLSKVFFQEAFVTETYHGGRNEQFWFGPAFEDDWYDYDLQSAYPTAMAMIGTPDWKKLRVLQDKTEVRNLQFDDLVFLQVTFKFPKKTRYPVLPVRALGGNLIFPLEGESYCTISELRLAEKMGVKWDLEYGVYVPSDKSQPIFAPFIKDCIQRRLEHEKGSFDNHFWKEVGNSTYGKTAQGLRMKRAYDVRSDDSKPIPPSKLTNPFFSSFITGFVRATLGEIMNNLPENRMVFSVTTDGFLTNARPEELQMASGGMLASSYLESRTKLINDDELITEIKHRVRQPLGWRTRGQATLKRGPEGKKGDPKPIVCAKAGIKVEYYFDDEQQNVEIIEKFLNRSPDDKILVRPFINIKDQLRYGNDNVEFLLEKKLSMEFDWKRIPHSAVDTSFTFNGNPYTHVCFHTKPWSNVDEFRSVRDKWEDYLKPSEHRMRNVKSLDDLKEFVQFANERLNIGSENKAYLKRKHGALQRIRTAIVTAFFKSHAGFSPQDVLKLGSKQNKKIADLLSENGVPCSAQDVANDKSKPFVQGTVPNTDQAWKVLRKIQKNEFPHLRIDDLIWEGKALTIKIDDYDPFIEMVTTEHWN